MGNEESRPENLTFNFEVDGGVITVNAKKSVQVIQEGDLAIFNLTDQEKVVRRYFKTDSLTTLLLSSNASDYQIDWSGMRRILYPVNAKIVNQSKKLVTVLSTELRNPSSQTGEFTWNANKSEVIQEKFKSTWFAETNVTSKVNIAYKIITLGTIDFSRKTVENVETERLRTSNLSTQTEIKVTLEPNRSVRVDLQAIFHTVDVEVEYEASVFGVMDVGYGRLRVGVMGSKALADLPDVPKTATYTEIITLEYYTDGDRVTMTTIDSD